MICEECQKLNKKSTIAIGNSMMTAVYYTPFYDENGKYHNHDNNKKTTSYSCSNGHKWSVSNWGSCWCGWKG